MLILGYNSNIPRFLFETVLSNYRLGPQPIPSILRCALLIHLSSNVLRPIAFTYWTMLLCTSLVVQKSLKSIQKSLLSHNLRGQSNPSLCIILLGLNLSLIRRVQIANRYTLVELVARQQNNVGMPQLQRTIQPNKNVYVMSIVSLKLSWLSFLFFSFVIPSQSSPILN